MPNVSFVGHTCCVGLKFLEEKAFWWDCISLNNLNVGLDQGSLIKSRKQKQN